jgi:5-oxoprolinase (ATP-hydrolysing)
MEIVTLRVRRVGEAARVTPSRVAPRAPSGSSTKITLADGREVAAPVFDRAELASIEGQDGPALLCDPDATAFIPPGWQARSAQSGGVLLRRIESSDA